MEPNAAQRDAWLRHAELDALVHDLMTRTTQLVQHLIAVGRVDRRALAAVREEIAALQAWAKGEP